MKVVFGGSYKFCPVCGEYGIRTHDLLHAMQAL